MNFPNSHRTIHSFVHNPSIEGKSINNTSTNGTTNTPL